MLITKKSKWMPIWAEEPIIFIAAVITRTSLVDASFLGCILLIDCILSNGLWETVIICEVDLGMFCGISVSSEAQLVLGILCEHESSL